MRAIVRLSTAVDERPVGVVTPPGGRGRVHRLWLAGIAMRQLRARLTLAVAQLLTLAAAATLVASVVRTMEDGRLA